MTTLALPELFISRLQQILPTSSIDAALRSFTVERDISFRINTLKAGQKEVIEQLEALGLKLHAVNWLEEVYTIAPEQRTLLTNSAAANEGLIYIQGLSSMLPALFLEPQPNERILDIAAAPGSKTLQMCNMMNNLGWISAVEIVKSRFFKLKDNLQRQGAQIVHTYLMDGSRVWKKCPEQFDRVLVDAPCSSESRFSTCDPESYQYWSEKKIKEQAKKQGKLLFSAIQSLKPGGVLVYSTCSFAPEENEVTVSKALKTFGDAIEILPLNLPIDNWQPGLSRWGKKEFPDELKHCRRIVPNQQMEGFFLCKIAKKHSTIKK